MFVCVYIYAYVNAYTNTCTDVSSYTLVESHPRFDTVFIFNKTKNINLLPQPQEHHQNTLSPQC